MLDDTAGDLQETQTNRGELCVPQRSPAFTGHRAEHCSLQPRKSNRLICPHCCNKPSTNQLEWNEDHDGLRRARSFQVSPNSGFSTLAEACISGTFRAAGRLSFCSTDFRSTRASTTTSFSISRWPAAEPSRSISSASLYVAMLMPVFGTTNSRETRVHRKISKVANAGRFEAW
jgi:hypothetical protein